MLNKFIAEIYNESLLKNDGFMQHGNHILITPIADFIKGYAFNKGNHLYINLFIMPTYIPNKQLSLDYGWRLKGNHVHGDMFFLDNERINFTKSEIIRLICESKELLCAVNTPMEFYDKVYEIPNFNKHKFLNTLKHLETMTYTLCYAGRNCNDLADDFLKQFKQMEADRMHLPWIQEIIANMEKLKNLACNRDNLRLLFDEWREFTIRNLKLERFFAKK